LARVYDCVIIFTIGFVWSAEVEKGDASYYADSLNGNKTASGNPYDKTHFRLRTEPCHLEPG
jgi:rare lipoprotein A (peptidoglycan hydrolase)